MPRPPQDRSSSQPSERVLILVVDDERDIRQVLRSGLEKEGFSVVEASTKPALFKALEQHPVRLITLDLGLGREDGLELTREIRASRNVPIIMITGRGDPFDRVTGLELGADDYITKPFHIREVVIRVHSVLARYSAAVGAPTELEPAQVSLAFDACVLDLGKRELRTSDGTYVDLTETELRLLEIFLRHPARVLSRDEIWQLLRGHDWTPMDRAVDGHVARLRRKIEPPGDEPTMIKSVRGVGYVFTADVWRVSPETVPSTSRKARPS